MGYGGRRQEEGGGGLEGREASLIVSAPLHFQYLYYNGCNVSVQTALLAAAGMLLSYWCTPVSGRRQHQYTVQQRGAILAVSSTYFLYLPLEVVRHFCPCPMRKHRRLHAACHTCDVHACACACIYSS